MEKKPAGDDRKSNEINRMHMSSGIACANETQNNATVCLLLAARGFKLVRTHGCPNNYKSLEASKHPLLQVLLSHPVQLFNLKASTPVSLTRWRYDQGGPGWTRVDQGKLPDSHLIFQLLQEIHRIRTHLSAFAASGAKRIVENPTERENH